MFDTEKFIYEIEKRPALWDTRLDSYRDRLGKGNDWSEVGQTMFAGWSDWSPEQQHMKGKELLIKWKSIKDKFRKCIKEEKSFKSSASAKRKKTYVYFQILQFMRPIMEENSNITIEEDSTPEAEISTDAKRKISHTQSQINNTVIKVEVDGTAVDDVIANDHRQLELLRQSEERKLAMTHDDDTLFALSLVESLKKIPTQLKLRTKIEIMSVIENNTYYGQ